MIWVAIITLAKDKIKQKIKNFLNPKFKFDTSQLIIDFEQEYQNLKKTLNMNIISIKDELSKYKKSKKCDKHDIVEYKDDKIDKTNDGINMYEVIIKTIEILKNLGSDIIHKIKSNLF
jgi:hypothetical protein